MDKTKPLDVKILVGGANWIGLAGRIVLNLSGYYNPLPPGSTVSVVGSDPARVCIEGIERLDTGFCDMAMTTPGFFTRLALEGLAPFSKPINVRTLATFPHDDRMMFAVKTSTGLKSIGEIKEKKYPLKISMSDQHSSHPATFGAREVLKEYGISFADIESWGGEFRVDRPADINAADGKIISDDFTAVFDEAIMTRRWKRLTDEYDLTFLPLEDDVLRRLEQRGWKRNVIKKGHFRGIDQDVATADFSGWTLCCHERMDDELAYLTIAAIDAQQNQISDLFPPPFPPMSGRIDMHNLGADQPVPLHPGAERYYREKGYL